jgi:signal transduction histidine kinase
MRLRRVCRGYLRSVRFAPVGVRRGWLVADATLLVVCVATSVALALGATGPGTPVAGPLWLSLPWAVLQFAPLLWRRRFPLAVCWAAMGALAVFSLATWESPMGLEIMAALAMAGYSASAYAPRPRALLALVPLVLGYVAYTVGNPDVRAGGAENYWAAAFFGAGTAAAWLIGLAVHAYREDKVAAALVETRQREVEAAVVAERGRIARELHDVVSHQLSVVVVQAAGARAQQQAGGNAGSGTLEKIESSGREALVEMRRLLDVLRSEGEPGDLHPSPGVADLPELVAGVRRAGLPVELDLADEVRDVPPVVGLAAFRVVQEALTNTLKHAGASAARVSVRRESGAVALEVVDDGTRRPDPAVGGYGLVGMKERISLLGGDFSAGPEGGRGFAVRATLPLDGA